ncbi:MAG: hypothetical protein QM733_20755 [Ilumatobacteraceae bacterium]
MDGDTRKIIDFSTLPTVAVEHTNLSGRIRRNALDPAPAVLMGRLAIDTSAQSAGPGRLLVRDAILSTLAAADRIGVRILLGHALHDPAAGSYETLGFERSPPMPCTCTCRWPTPASSLNA